MRGIRDTLLENSGLTVDQAEILVELYGASKLPEWTYRADSGTFVPIKKLREEMVHGTASISRRIKELGPDGMGFIEVGKTKARDRPSPRHFNEKALRITAAGLKVVKPIWEGYRRMAECLLEGVSKTDRQAHLRVNRKIQERLKPSAPWMAE